MSLLNNHSNKKIQKNRPVRDLMKKIYRKKPWNQAVTFVAAVLVFVTTYMLILPAITMTKPVLDCPYAAYQDPNSIILHQHDAACYNSDGELICTLPELKIHVHDDSCYEDVVLGYETIPLAQALEEGRLDDAVVSETAENALFYDSTATDEFTVAADAAGDFSDTAAEQVNNAVSTDILFADTEFSDDAGAVSDPGTIGQISGETIPAVDSQDPGYNPDSTLDGSQIPQISQSDDGNQMVTVPIIEKRLICGREELNPEIHVHDDSCYETVIVENEDGSITEKRILTCTKPVVFFHQHGEECFKKAEAEDIIVYDEEAKDSQDSLPQDDGQGIVIYDEPQGEYNTADYTEDNSQIDDSQPVEDPQDAALSEGVPKDEGNEVPADSQTDNGIIEYYESSPVIVEEQGALAPKKIKKKDKTDSKTEINTEIITETITETISESASEFTTEITAETSTEPLSEFSTEMTTKAPDEPEYAVAAGITTEAVNEPVSEASSEITTEAVDGVSSEAVNEFPSEAAPEITTEISVEVSSEAAIEEFSETAAETATEAAAQVSSEISAEITTELFSEASSEINTELFTEAFSEITTELFTKASSEVTTEAAEAVLTFDGTDYHVRLRYDSNSGIPEDAGLSVTEIDPESGEYGLYLSQAKTALGLAGDAALPKEYARFFDITILDQEGNEVQPNNQVKVEIIYDQPVADVKDENVNASVLHFDEEKNAEVLSTLEAGAEEGVEISMEGTGETGMEESADTSDTAGEADSLISEGTDQDFSEEGAEDNSTGVTFTTDSFSVFGIIYTVDFHWEVNGEDHEYSITGGGVISLRALVEELHLLDSKPADSDAEEIDTSDTSSLSVFNNGLSEEEVTLSDEGEEATISDYDSFMRDIIDVTFSDETLVKPIPVSTDTTAGELIDLWSLEPVYSADLTGKSITEMKDRTFHAADWALVSLKPFDTVETLSITMSDGTVISIAVTDARIVKPMLTADGETWLITVTYDDKAGIPEDADLDVREIVPEKNAKGGETEYDHYIAMIQDTLKAETDAIDYARIFDIKILDANGDKVIISAPVDVKVELADKNDDETAYLDTRVVHFADGAETGDVVETLESDGGAIRFTAEGFSAYAIVDGPEAGSMGWNKVTSLAELDETGFYIGHVDGYYFTNATDITGTGNNTRTGIRKTKPASSRPVTTGSSDKRAVLYYFERVSDSANQFYIYCYDNNGNKQYVYNGNDNSLSFAANASEKTAFTVTVSDDIFRISNGVWYWNMQNSANGTRFCSFNNAADVNAKLYIWKQYETPSRDPYYLEGKMYGLMNWNGGVSGRAMMADRYSYVKEGDEETTTVVPEGSLGAMPLTVMAKKQNYQTKLFVPHDMLNYSASMWSFEWVENDRYYLKSGGKYLSIGAGGLTMKETCDDSCRIQVVPGTGVHAGQIILKSANDVTLTYSGNVETGFSTGSEAGTEYLYLIDPRENTTDFVMTYSATKVSVSDPEKVATGKKVIVYTRFWVDGDENVSGHYDYYAINSKGELVRCFERGDSIEWVGSIDNDMLWQFTQYCYDDGEWKPYCELENVTSHQYIAPSMSKDTILSGEPVGIILPGRRNGQYYTPILTWDQGDYHYSGMRPDSNTGGSDAEVIPCSIWDAEDFYFAVMEDIPVDDKLNTVETIDNNLYGITMKMVDLTNSATNSLNGQMNKFFNNTTNNGLTTVTTPNLLTTELFDDNPGDDLGADHGYPKAVTGEGGSLKNLFGGTTKTVNHLFIESTYYASGYFEYDSTQNFASLNLPSPDLPNPDDEIDFTVYKELGTTDMSNRDTLKHGQFFPYDQIEAGRFASVNKENMYTPQTNGLLPDSDPRKHELLYLIKNQSPDYYFGMELDAGFDQTPNGLDAWGHDIIFEFSGDDDFWLYVDGQLVIDLGGIHSAVPGSVNFRTGDVNVNGTHTTLSTLFYNNYISQGHTEEEAQAYVNERFITKYDEELHRYVTVFKDETHHTMRIFYFERGAGASNLHMRFNLATVKKGTVQLTKKLGGLDSTESSGAKFAYQILYRKADESVHYLTNAPQSHPEIETNESGEEDSGETSSEGSSGSGDGTDGEGGSGSGNESGSEGGNDGPNMENPDLDPYDRVCYKDTHDPVEYLESVVIDGVTYQNVFFIVPGDRGTVDITFPPDMTDYRIIECGVNTDIYYQVNVNDVNITDSKTCEYGSEYTYTASRYDFPIAWATTAIRPKVTYENFARKQNLQIRKRLWFRRDEASPIQAEGDQRKTSAPFNFRLYFGTEFDDNPNDPAYIYSYHVIDTEGDYCKRNTETNGKFEKIEQGKKYEELTDEQKRLATFHSGTGGSISEIPAYYTVEIRDVLVGSPYRIAELGSEMPDGFEYWRYMIEEYETEPSGVGEAASPAQDTGISSTVKDGKTSLVYVDNIKGFGLRMDKTWADAEDIKDRASAYFAVFLKGENDTLTYVNDSMKELPLKDNNGNIIRQTLYWYYDSLPAGAQSLDDLVVLEVKPAGMENSSPEAIMEGDYVVLSALHVQAEERADRIYKVSYGEPSTVENVRIFSATNTPDNPVIVLKKTQWDGETPLSGAGFTLKAGSKSNDYTSGTDGMITTLYPQFGTDYVLTETLTPQTWQGLPYPITFSMNVHGEVSVTSECGNEWYILNQASSNSPATLIVKNRPFRFKVIKKDGQTGAPLKNVSFDLWKYVNSGAGYVPSPLGNDYNNLKTDSDGIVPKVNENLAAGDYQLHETPPQIYQPLQQNGNEQTSFINFSISAVGNVTLSSNNPEGVSMTSTDGENGEIIYNLSILNYPQVIIEKTDEEGNPIKGAKFRLNRYTTSWTVYNGGGISNGVIDLMSNDCKTITYIPDGRYQLVEEAAPEGYIFVTKNTYFKVERVEGRQLIYLTDEDGNLIPGDEEGEYLNIVGDATLTTDNTAHKISIKIKNHPGAALPNTGGPGTSLFCLIGSILMMSAGMGIIMMRRRKETV